HAHRSRREPRSPTPHAAPRRRPTLRLLLSRERSLSPSPRRSLSLNLNRHLSTSRKRIRCSRQRLQRAPVEEACPAQQAETPAPSAQQAPQIPGEAIVENRMESMIRESLKKPFFQEVLKEWALHVEDAAETKTIDATTFANLYLEMMRDPRNDE